jgi:hypothetical protein
VLSESVNVTVILDPDPAYSDTSMDLTIDVVAVGTVNIVVLSVVVNFTFLFINLLAIIVQRN